ncbi:hypothetical protein [Cerasicoccus frondis]|uniref:hypothetical protein n=1 Tax=Cerasicoccus frondis TaxID=490090 RepID=UPI0028526773|nr:hypothetical protein [Cerasicoccus frondis]
MRNTVTTIILAGLCPIIQLYAQTDLQQDTDLQIVDGAGVNELNLKWFAFNNYAYIILQSPDLETWTIPVAAEQVFVGQDQEITGLAFMKPNDPNADPNQLAQGASFFKLVMSPKPLQNPLEFDPDNDRVGSTTEFSLGWNPLDASSSDGDIVPDDLENYYWGGLSRDGTGNADGDALNDYGDILAGGDSETADNFEDDADSDTVISVMAGLGALGEDWPEVSGFSDSVAGNADLVIYIPEQGFQMVTDDGTFLELSGKVPHF